MRIQIVRTPPGFLPLWVRQAWVRIKLESVGRENKTGEESDDVFRVMGNIAFNALKIHNGMAYNWWKAQFNLELIDSMVFLASVCKEIVGAN